MNMKTHLILAWVAMAALLGNAAPEDAIGFHGFLAYADGGPIDTAVPIKIDFSLYDAPTGGTLLWARRIPVSLGENGGFYVDLRDAAGDPLPAEKTTLARALAAAPNGKTYLAYAPEGSTPGAREELVVMPAAYFARTARIVDEAAPAGVKAERIDVLGTAKFEAACPSEDSSGDIEIASTNEIRICKGIQNFNYICKSGPHELVPLYDWGGSYVDDVMDSFVTTTDLFYWARVRYDWWFDGKYFTRYVYGVVPYSAGSECYVGNDSNQYGRNKGDPSYDSRSYVTMYGYHELGIRQATETEKEEEVEKEEEAKERE